MICAALLFFLACGGSAADTAEASDTEAPPDSPTDTGAGDDTAAIPTFEADVGPLLERRCARCHEDFGGAEAYAAVVGPIADEAPDMALVRPGDREASYLWHKVNGTQASAGGSGAQMPKDRALPEADRALLGAWIDGGALR